MNLKYSLLLIILPLIVISAAFAEFEIKTENYLISNIKVKGPSISGVIKNTGTRTIKSLKLIVYYLDKSGSAVDEAQVYAVQNNNIFHDGLLKPNYSKSISYDFLKLSSISPEWNGQYKVDVIDVEYAD